MRPFILKSVEFEQNEMVVYADTDQGMYEFPVLPALNGQKNKYITGFERGKYVVRTKDYAKLKSGDYGLTEEICLAHEICHYDRQVIAPAYSTMRYLARLPLNQEQKEMLKSVGFFLAEKLENTLEDLFSVPLLKNLGYSPRDIMDAIDVNPESISALAFNANRFNEFIKASRKIDIRELIRHSFPFKTKVRFPWVVQGIFSDHWVHWTSLESLENIIRMDAGARIRLILKTYRLMDEIAFNTFKKVGVVLSKAVLLKLAENKFMDSINPYDKLRWFLELQSLRGNKVDFEKSIRVLRFL